MVRSFPIADCRFADPGGSWIYARVRISCERKTASCVRQKYSYRTGSYSDRLTQDDSPEYKNLWLFVRNTTLGSSAVSAVAIAPRS